MGHQQPPTPVVTDSANSSGFVNDSIRQQKSREIDMRFYWVRDMAIQVHYLVYCAIGKDNLDAYFTNHHPKKYHRSIKGTYLVPTDDSIKHA